MARRRQLVAASRTPIASTQRLSAPSAHACATLLMLVLALPGFVSSQTRELTISSTELASQLFARQQWNAIVQLAEPLSSRSPDLNFYYGLALAQLGQLQDAQRVLLEGHRQQPRDKRFPIELAGVAFKQKRYESVKRWLHCGLQLDARDSYANDFLATVYFLQGNLEAALKYWNRAGKPYLVNLELDPALRIDPRLLDRAIVFAPASVLQRRELLGTQQRLSALEVFPNYAIDLSARKDGSFDATLRAVEHDGFGANRWQALLSTFGGVPYATIYPAYYNINRNAENLQSLLRWDKNKRRALLEFASPLEASPAWRWSAAVDLRNENWDVVNSFQGSSPLLGALNLRREAFRLDLTHFAAGTLLWSLGAELSHRDYRSIYAGTAISPSLLLTGYQWKEWASFSSDLLRLPEHRLVLSAGVVPELGHIWSTPSHDFGKLQGWISGHWFPQPRGDDYEMRQQIKLGKILGNVPFDELYMLGIERDNDLWLRAHPGTRDGRKGSAPLGQSYFLSNFDLAKNLYSNGLLQVRLGPFFDVGRIGDAVPTPTAHKWLFDTGAQATVRAFGVGVVFTYGKNLRQGNNAFYATLEKRFGTGEHEP
jgi:tetratricopeptide (TPR) repeat protein